MVGGGVAGAGCGGSGGLGPASAGELGDGEDESMLEGGEGGGGKAC